jgi:hypothetical protein
MILVTSIILNLLYALEVLDFVIIEFIIRMSKLSLSIKRLKKIVRIRQYLKNVASYFLT